MTTESNRQAGMSAPSPRPAELKASDFFPPGTGWNQAKKPDETNDPTDVAKKTWQ